MKSPVKTAVFSLLSACALFATELPVFTTFTNQKVNELDSAKYTKELAEWNALPATYSVFQVVQVVVPNDELKAYESKFISLGKVSRDECLKKASGTLKTLPAELKGRAVTRCLSLQDEIGASDPDAEQMDLYQFYEDKDGANLVVHGMDQLKELYAGMKASSENVFKKDRKYNFKQDGYLLCKQSLPSSFAKDVPVAAREKEKPEFARIENFNATVKGGTVCNLAYSIDDLSFYDDNATVEQVGSDADSPKCYKLAKGSSVFAQKLSNIPGTYRISYVMQKDAEHYTYEATTLPGNVEFIQKKTGSAFK